jgi:hypothetical protein
MREDEEEIPGRRRRRGKRSAGKRRGARQRKAVTGAVREGAVQSRRNLKGTSGPIVGALRSLMLGVLRIFFDLLAVVLNLAIAVFALVAGPGRRVLRALNRLLRAASRALTPPRALAIVVAGAAVLLALSQFADYRGVSIGTDAYANVETVAPPPEVDRRVTGDPHSYVFVPVAAISLLLLATAMQGRRWRACRLIALCGVAAIVVGLVVDRPAGLDPGTAAQEFEGVDATLLGGFYAQIFAGVLLTASSLMLGRELRLAGATKSARGKRARRGMRASRRRRPDPIEGARA